jgi:hypothetical protein
MWWPKLRWQFRYGTKPPRDACISVREAGKLGAAARNAKAKERIHEKARQLNVELGAALDLRLERRV